MRLGPSRARLRFKHWHAYAPRLAGLTESRTADGDVTARQSTESQRLIVPRPPCPRASLPRCGATAPRAASKATWTGITPSSSLILAHAPNHDPLADLVYGLERESLQVAASPCWDVVLPDVISAGLSLVAWTLTPVGAWVHVPVTSPGHSGVPLVARGVAFPRMSEQRFQFGMFFRGCSHLLMFRLPDLLATLIARHPGWRPRQPVAFTSERNTGCHLPVHRIC